MFPFTLVGAAYSRALSRFLFCFFVGTARHTLRARHALCEALRHKKGAALRHARFSFICGLLKISYGNSGLFLSSFLSFDQIDDFADSVEIVRIVIIDIDTPLAVVAD